MKRLELTIEGVPMSGWVEKIQSKLWVHIEGETFIYEPPKKQRSKNKMENSNPGQITAPMPGKIVKVQVVVEQKVEAGQVLVVLEAMKMEYTLKSPSGGTVEFIGGKPGEQVSLGQVLIRLKDLADSSAGDKSDSPKK